MLLVIGGTLAGVGSGMLVTVAVALAGDGRDVAAFAIPGAVTTIAGAALVAPVVGRRRGMVTHRPIVGFLAVALAWVAAAIVGAVPFMAADVLDRPLDAVFEAMSGFTTTGATVILEMEPQSDAVLFWRSLTQWLGGVGIVVFVVSIAPASGLALQRVFFAEVSGIRAERLTPRIIDTAQIIVGIYLVLSLVIAVGFVVAGMNVFESVNHTMTTVATGGFSTRTASIGGFDSLPIELVAIAGMVLGGVNFAFYWSVIRRGRLMPQLAEVRAYLALIVAAIALLTASLLLADDVEHFGQALRSASFSVASIMTTTGYVTDDFDGFNSFFRVSLLALMAIGACAGSTAGGMKVIRVVLLWKAARQELDRQIQPTAVHVLRFGGHSLSEDVRRAILGFFGVYVTVFVAGFMAFTVFGVDMVSALSATASTINVTGPALGDFGAFEPFAAMPDGGKAVAIFLMLTGRLEIFTVIAILAAVFGYFRRTQARPTGLPRW
jgi:trk system potassium uptake protein TrkH